MQKFLTYYNLISEAKESKNTCWSGYKAIGVKMKNGKKVPNCVPESLDFDGLLDMFTEANARCTKVTGKTSSTRKDKKWMKCVKSGSGYKRIHWGQKGVRVTGDSGNTARKKSFRARHKCSTAKPGTPRYQACKDW